MNAIKFAKLHAGETFYFCGEEVKVVGYDSMNCGASVIVEGFSMGWCAGSLSLGDVILVPPTDTEQAKYWYVDEYDLDRTEIEKPMRILIIGKPGMGKSRMAELIKLKYRLPIVEQPFTGWDHIPTVRGIYVLADIDPVEAAKRKDEFKLIIIM